MIKKEITKMKEKKKNLKMNLALAAIGVLLVLGCPASSNGGPDTIAPTLQSSNPPADSTSFSADASITLTYSEAVQAGTGNITITPSAGAAITIAVDDAQVSIAGAVVTINPTADLAMSTTYTLTIPAGAFMDVAGNKTAELTLSFSTAAALDTTAPSFDSSLSVPVADATDFPANSNIVLTYNEPVQAGTGNITITPSGGAAITIAVTDAQVSFSGAVVTIDPSADLMPSTEYTLNIPAGAIQDLANNPAAIVNLSFRTAAALDETAPILASSVPAEGATDINASLNIILSYNEPVQAGTGNITLTPTTSGSSAPTLTIAVTDAQVSISGAVVTINPTNNLAVSTTYTLTIPDGAFMDAAGNMTAEITLSFLTAAVIVPTVISSVPAADGTINAATNLELTFSTAVAKGSGSIFIRSAFSLTELPVAHSNVSIAGAVVTIIPSFSLVEGRAYTLSFAAGVFVSSTDQTAAPAFSLDFTTLDTMPPILSSSVPASGATNVAADRDIVLTYNETIQAGAGNMTLTPMGGKLLMIPVTDAQVSIFGSMVTINPSANLERSTEYTLTIPAGAFTDASGNSAPQLILSFTTAGLLTPAVSSSVPAEGEILDFPNDGTIVRLTYNQAVVKGSGNIMLLTSNRTMNTIAVSDEKVSISGNVVSIDISGFPSDRVSHSAHDYVVALTVPVAAFANADGNNPLGPFTLEFMVSRPAGE